MSTSLNPKEGNMDPNMLDQVMATQKITVSDVCSAFRVPIGRNEKPFTLAVKKLNNKIIDDWKDDVLDVRAIDSKLQAIGIHKYWDSYKTGLEIYGLKDANSHFSDATGQTISAVGKGKEKTDILQLPTDLSKEIQVFPRMTQEQIKWWKAFFDNDIESIHSYGFMVVSIGWTYITTELRLAFAEEKWRRLYGKSDDPVYWNEKYNCLDLIENMGLQPFGWSVVQFEEIKEKVSTIINNQIAPRR
jgi:hypothetical protein